MDITGFESYKLHKYSLGTFAIKEDIASRDEIDCFKKYRAKHGKMWALYNRLFADNSKYFQEKSFAFDPKVLKLRDDVYLDGYWQTDKYFKDIEPLIHSEFSFVLPQGEKDKGISKLITACTAVSLHVRRADYVTNISANKVHGTCGLDYYDRAMKLITEKVDDPHFFVFSDDPEWAKQNLRNAYPTVYVDHNGADTNYQDLRLMASCKHHIIANSSFSWWGAWLNEDPNKIVIAPKQWFSDVQKNTNDLIPPTWIRL